MFGRLLKRSKTRANTKSISRFAAVSASLYGTKKAPEWLGKWCLDAERDNKHITVVPHMLPHIEKLHRGGEDSFYVGNDGMSFGVFDGVGGWADQGVNPRDYTFKLSEGCQAVYEKGVTDPVEIMQAGYDGVRGLQGSCTACVVTINDGVFSAANLGDSGFLIVRDGQIILRSKEQQHSFNFPYQLGPQSSDKPKHSDLYTIDVKSGDLILLGTDGLFDNLFDKDILANLQKIESDQIKQTAAKIGVQALKASRSMNTTPFEKHAKAHRYNFRGGKEDDITVVLAKIK
eukprot:TRINITY_DN3621_c0_g1_i1.p1 TRINITY_DN3621_c0_g1~~TRINITY_DN3621_c0_g1_i1.p1  ORF type:complete len:288 (+),score=63.25 TRINITY_DN3621_c0_g1_i1:22-885(+)